jgi:hypothetical protein
MSASRAVRQVHRWVSLAFTALVLANIGANVGGWSGPGAQLLGMVTLLPLVVLLVTGMVLFVQPYRAAR